LPPGLSTQGVLAIITLLGAFLIMGIYVWRGESPDATVTGLISLPLGAVIGFFFGHSNGTTSALANAATALANRTNPGEAVSQPLPPAPPGVTHE
jgi:hypothetical protein